MSSVCVPAKEICPNMLRGFCAGCKESHNIWHPLMGCAASNLVFNRSVWCYLGKWDNLSRRLQKAIENAVGKMKRID